MSGRTYMLLLLGLCSAAAGSAVSDGKPLAVAEVAVVAAVAAVAGLLPAGRREVHSFPGPVFCKA